MDLKETVNAILVVDALEPLLKVHAMREARGKALTHETAQQIVKELRPRHPVFADVIERVIKWMRGRLWVHSLFLKLLKGFCESMQHSTRNRLVYTIRTSTFLFESKRCFS